MALAWLLNLGFAGSAVVEALSITTTSLPDATVDEAYSETLQAEGGTTPFTWSVSAGTLPDGLSLNSSTGEISGTPTTAEEQTFTVQVTDNASTTDTQQLTITVNAVEAPTTGTKVGGVFQMVRVLDRDIPAHPEFVLLQFFAIATGEATPIPDIEARGKAIRGKPVGTAWGETYSTATAEARLGIWVQVLDVDVEMYGMRLWHQEAQRRMQDAVDLAELKVLGVL